MLIDQHFTRGVIVDFLGRPALTNPILGKFVRRYECPVHGVRVVRLGRHRFRLELTPPLTRPSMLIRLLVPTLPVSTPLTPEAADAAGVAGRSDRVQRRTKL